jgi:hypothetical protein
MNDYIKERLAEWAMNIDDFQIGENILDFDGSICVITNKTANSIEVSIKRKSEKGIDCKNWFEMRNFNKRFKKI